MRVAVVTPYYSEKPEILRRCYDSVRAQTHPVLHLFVADGTPCTELEEWDCDHLCVNGPHRDAGNMARGIGALQCVAHDFDAIAFLDSDNWYKPDHIEYMIDLVAREKAQVGAAIADAYRMDGSFAVNGEPLPPGSLAIDTNCFFITKGAFPLLPLWLQLSHNSGSTAQETERKWSLGGLIGDKIFAYALRAFQVPIAFAQRSTVCYTAKSATFYEHLGEAPPPGSVRDDDLVEAWNWWCSLTPAQRQSLVAKAIPRDRRPQVDMG